MCIRNFIYKKKMSFSSFDEGLTLKRNSNFVLIFFFLNIKFNFNIYFYRRFFCGGGTSMKSIFLYYIIIFLQYYHTDKISTITSDIYIYMLKYFLHINFVFNFSVLK